MGIGDWGLGIGDWGLGPIPNPQSPIPNPQSPKLSENNKIHKNKFFKLIKQYKKTINLRINLLYTINNHFLMNIIE